MSELISLKKFRSDYRVSDFQIPQTKLCFQIFEWYTIVRAELQVLRTNSEARELILDGENLEFISCTINNQEVDTTTLKITEHSLSIPWIYGDECMIQIQNKIYPEKNTFLEWLYYASGFYCTQNEPMGFRHITYFLDRPDVMSIFQVRIEGEKKYPLLLSNGNKIASGELENNRHFVEWSDPFRKPTYLFALVCADLEEIHDTYTTGSGKMVDLYVYVDHGKGKDALWAMESLKRAMKWDEVRYGREYDLNVFHIVATDSFNMGAMENKSLNIFNTIYIRANDRTSTDKDFIDVEAVIGHEYFHNWTGNRITCRDWFQLTLKEGLTVFRDQNFSADMHSELTQRIVDIELLREFQFAEDKGKTAHPIQPDSYVEMNNFYTATVYDKGAEVIRMMESMVGREKFREGMDLYFARHDGQAVTTVDFVRAISDGSGMDFSEFEKSWYHQPRTPEISVKTEYDINQQTFTLHIAQKSLTSPEGETLKPWYIPLFIALFDPDSKQEFPLQLQNPEWQNLLEKWAILLTQESQSFTFSNITSEPVVSLNRGFRAPVIIESSDVDYRFLSLYETNGISRYDAWKQYSIEALRTFIQKNYIDAEYITTFQTILEELPEDTLYHSLLLNFRNITSLLNVFAPINPILLSEKRSEFLKNIGTNTQIQSLLFSKFEKEYNEYMQTEETIDDESIKKRAYISSIALLMSEFWISTREIEEKLIKSTKMTLNLAGWKSRIARDAEIWIAELKNWMRVNGFFDDLLMRMKYFSLISQVSSPVFVDILNSEIESEYFDYKVPNLVRSLIGWVTKSFHFFHKDDAEGYRFFAEQIRKIDMVNTQIAARLVKSFTSYELVDEVSKSRMKPSIEWLLHDPKISAGVKEILEKVIS